MKKVLLSILSVFFVSAIGFSAFAAEGDEVVPMPDGVISFPFTKTWDDNNNADGSRPESIEVTLTYYQGEGDTTGTSVTKTVTGDPTADEWTYTFELVDTEADPLFYGDDLTPCIFKVTETAIDGYTETAHVDPSLYMTVEYNDNDRHEPCNHLEIPISTTTYPKSWVAIKKGGTYFIWTPEELSPLEKKMLHNTACTIQGFHSEEAKLETFLTGFGPDSNVGFYVDEESSTIVFDKESQWSLIGWGKYTRSVEENKCSITNAKAPDTGSVTVTKSFSGADALPSDFKITNDFDKELEFTVSNATGEGTERSPYTWTIADVPVGTEVTFEETGAELPAYELMTVIDPSTGKSAAIEKDKTAVVSFVNTYTLKTIDVTVTKVWDDADDKDGLRPETLALTLNGVPEGFEPPEPEVTKDGNSWTYTWKGVPEIGSDGQEIAYTITEESVPEGYEVSGSPAENGGTITNTHEPAEELIEITVSKVWSDEDDKDGIRPSSVEVKLLADGEEADVAALILSESNGWKGSWADLPKYADDKEIVYTVQETPVEGYAAAVAGDVENGFVVANAHIPEEPEEPVIPKTGDDAPIAPLAIVLLTSGAVLAVAQRKVFGRN